MDRAILTQLRRHEAQVGELTKIVGQLRAVAEQHHVAIADLEETLRRMIRQAERDQDLDDGVLDLPAKDRAGLKALDKTGNQERDRS